MKRFLVFLLAAHSAPQQPPPSYEVFYLAVGSSHYVRVPTFQKRQGKNEFENLGSGTHSAARIASLLQDAGSIYGITLLSTPERGVGRRDIFAQLDSLLAAVRRSRAARPLIVYYFVGHGLSEGIGWNHFSVPGDFTYYGAPANLSVDVLSERAVYTGELFDRLEASQHPFVMLLDNCQSGRGERFQNPVLTDGAASSLRGASAALRAFNEFRETTPVVFATKPGTTAVEVLDPFDQDSAFVVGPLARRLMLAKRAAALSHQSMTLVQLVNALGDPQLDTDTRTAVTYGNPGSIDGVVLPVNAKRHGVHLTRMGTARLTTSGTPRGRLNPNSRRR